LYWWGIGPEPARANCFDCGSEWSARSTAPAGRFDHNPYGLYDTAGNVAEWVQDCYHANYEGAPDDGTARTACPEPGYHSIRGGSYGDAGEFHDPRFRLRGPADQGFFTVGFRLARDL